jgi:hypothetical protein
MAELKTPGFLRTASVGHPEQHQARDRHVWYAKGDLRAVMNLLIGQCGWFSG